MTYPNTVISMPSQLFTMRSSFKAVANGSVYIGEIDTDPTIPTNQIQVYIEQENGTLVPVAQPIKINSAGLLTASGQVQKFVLTNTEYSMTVQNSYGVDEFYFPRVYDQGISAALEVEERLLGPGAKIYRGLNGQYVENGNVVPSENPPYTHLSVPINGKSEDVLIYPTASGVVSNLTETSADIGGTPVEFFTVDNVSFKKVTTAGSSVSRALREMLDDFVNPLNHGATNDKTTDYTSIIQSCIDYANLAAKPILLTTMFVISAISLPAESTVLGTGYGSGFIVNTTGTSTINVTGSNVELSDFRLKGVASGGVRVKASDDSLVVSTRLNGLLFETDGTKLNQCVWLFNSANTVVSGCDFAGTGYGVISQYGYQANDVLVDGCTFSTMIDDAVAANSGGPIISYRWTVNNCKYLGNQNFPYSGNEGRFVSTASVYEVTLSGNTVVNAGGDSAVHIESNGGNTTINGCTFKDCFGAQGQDGWIYLLNSTKDVNIAANVFIYENSLLGFQSAISVSSGSYTHASSWMGNIFLDISGAHQFSAFNVKSVQAASNLVISMNVGRGLNKFADLNNSKRISFIGNSVRCVDGIVHSPGATGGAAEDYIINANMIDLEDNGDGLTHYALNISRNSNGTQPPRRHSITDNVFNGNVLFAWSEDSTFALNKIGASATYTINNHTRFTSGLNSQVGVGTITL